MSSPPDATDSSTPSPRCRLCEGATRRVMTKTLMDAHQVNYWGCDDCGSLQTDNPWWLAEAYAIPDIGTDVGICQRTLQLVLETTALLALLAYPPTRHFVDFGGANGLFTRMMRDRGLNFFSYDRYQKPFYAPQFAVGCLTDIKPDVITAFEVFEHFPNPKREIAELTDLRPEMIIFTTETYQNQGDDWYYFAPESGQHVFFYTTEALSRTAMQAGYRYFNLGLLKIFAHEDYIAERLAARVDVNGLFAKVARNRPGFINQAIRLLTEHLAAPNRHVFADLRIAIAHAKRQKE